MADYKGRIRPPVYDGEGTATYPDVFYPETKSDIVKDPDTGISVKQQINDLGDESTMPHKVKDVDNNKTYKMGLQIKDGKTQIMYEEVV